MTYTAESPAMIDCATTAAGRSTASPRSSEGSFFIQPARRASERNQPNQRGGTARDRSPTDQTERDLRGAEPDGDQRRLVGRAGGHEPAHTQGHEGRPITNRPAVHVLHLSRS